ncbi:MAG: hypothetical protein WBP64_07905 [Nitrososphaeraceae archaeon]
MNSIRNVISGKTGGPNAKGAGDPFPELINYARMVEPWVHFF